MLFIQDVFLAGVNAGVITMIWTMTELTRHPRVMKKLQKKDSSNTRFQQRENHIRRSTKSRVLEYGDQRNIQITSTISPLATKRNNVRYRDSRLPHSQERPYQDQHLHYRT